MAIEEGRIVSCVVRLEENAGAWASAPTTEWLDTVIEPDAKRVRSGGNRLLASLLLNELHRTLFSIPVR